MQLITERAGTIDLLTTPIHLGLGATALPIDGWAWDPEALEAYTAAVASDGVDARTVLLMDTAGDWSTWERHPAGAEVVVCLSGRMTLVQELDETTATVALAPGQAAINPRGVWHTADVHEPGQILTITAGIGTQHRQR